MAAPSAAGGIGIANLPNQVSSAVLASSPFCHSQAHNYMQKHKIVAKKGAHFTVMVVGELDITSF